VLEMILQASSPTPNWILRQEGIPKRRVLLVVACKQSAMGVVGRFLLLVPFVTSTRQASRNIWKWRLTSSVAQATAKRIFHSQVTAHSPASQEMNEDSC
jgi:hypothetical protein